MTDNRERYNLFLMNTIGMSILCETLREAARFEITASPRSETYQCYAFVQGSGLENLLVTYQLDYEADEIRSHFNYFVHRINGNGKH